MSQWIKDLPHKFKDRSSNPQSPCKTQVEVIVSCNPSAQEVETVVPRPSWLARLAKLGSFGFHKRSWLRKVESKQGKHPRTTICLYVHEYTREHIPIHIYPHTYTYTYAHMYINIHKLYIYI